eukprot:CAMPEP_0174370836 /NCGR_PEP_ID=MMETSP0811_2-20130205/97455_1 /TAXON_ID=73025 ORGANISM="Eutreptiella gymnastica-like, Strain CCMP1594" /NCGR_SAMPLE_ID=MMETSP0811_2 /ASSEMBLY_ACC=CAM_ASM_000667 /LENGTH=79 /DNA_ID=CAMNT_0015516623 /DNA_START=1614 /DNA_END=1854 /DNA_ORIENTATION=+
MGPTGPSPDTNTAEEDAKAREGGGLTKGGAGRGAGGGGGGGAVGGGAHGSNMCWVYEHDCAQPATQITFKAKRRWFGKV